MAGIMQAIGNLSSANVIRKTGSEYRLKRPVDLYVKRSVINQLKNIYQKSSERGGLLLFRPVSGSLVCSEFIEVPNKSLSNTHYSPNMALWRMEVEKAVLNGALPIPVHTHPTQLGFDEYDSKRKRFYLKSSKPDRAIARQTDIENLNLPEAIFVKDERFGTGYGLAFYEGTIFPNSLASLSDLQIGLSAAAALLALYNKLSRKLLYLVSAAFVFEFIRRPRYIDLKNGDLLVKVG